MAGGIDMAFRLIEAARATPRNDHRPPQEDGMMHSVRLPRMTPRSSRTHRGEAAAALPANADVVTGDLTGPESLDAGLRGVSAVFLVWTAPPATAPAVVEHLATYARRVVLLSAPHQTPHPFFQQPNPMAELHAEIERLIAAAGLESTIIRPGMLASNALLWRASAIRAGGVLGHRIKFEELSPEEFRSQTEGRWPRPVDYGSRAPSS